jgi:periplasmic protein TonB
MSLNDPAVVLGMKAGPTKPARRDAVGAEIPVTVHASRTTQGFGNNLPPVHEDTKTVIVLAEGAVVRMTAALVAGETVVLTNRMTGADVLCRVGRVKAQPGIQQYVDLEFTHRAPGFWGDVLTTSVAPAVVQSPAGPPPAPPVAVVSPAVTPAPPPPVSIAPPPAPRPVAPPSPISVAPVSVAPVSPAPPAISLPAPVAAAPPPVVMPTQPAPMSRAEPPAVIHEQLQPAALAEPTGSSWNADEDSTASSYDESPKKSTMGTIGRLSGSETSESTANNLWKIAAAIALLLTGAGGSYWFFGQKSSKPAAVEQAAAVPAVRPAAPSASLRPGAPAAAPSDPVPQPVPELTPTPQTDIVLESRAAPLREERVSRVQLPAAAAAPEPRTVAEHRNSLPIGQMKAPKAKAAPVRMDSNSAAPALVGTLNLGDNALLAAENLSGALPAAPAKPALGGQLQPPQIQISVPPVYPANARALKLQGDVELDALVDETGKVTETNIISGPPALTGAARDAVQKWKYKPAQLNGKPIAVHTRVSLRFNLAQ